jgi:hypothetical protein
MRSGPSNGSSILELQVAIDFRIKYQDSFHITHSKVHEVIPPLDIAAARCCFMNLCAADHCIYYTVEIRSASSPSCRISHSHSSHILQYACPLSQFMSLRARTSHLSQWLLMLKFGRIIYFSQFIPFIFTFPALRANIPHAHWSDVWAKHKAATGDALLAIQTQTELWKRRFKAIFTKSESMYDQVHPSKYSRNGSR